MPADCILLQTTEKAGSCFIRTDQLDGETDWKLRLAVADTQEMTSFDGIEDARAEVCMTISVNLALLPLHLVVFWRVRG